MKTISKILVALCMAFSMLLTAGCGGGGSSNNNTLSGTAATGAPMDGFVHVIDATGTEINVAISIDGSYSINVQGMTGPFLLKAMPTAGDVQYSWASAAGEVVNITPLTTLALFLEHGDDLAALYTNWVNAYAAITRENLRLAQARINANFANLFTNANLTPTTYDFFMSRFSANGSGIDGVLDNLSISISNTQGWHYSISVNGGAFSFNANIDISGYNIGVGGSSGGGSGGGSSADCGAACQQFFATYGGKVLQFTPDGSVAKGALVSEFDGSATYEVTISSSGLLIVKGDSTEYEFSYTEISMFEDVAHETNVMYDDTASGYKVIFQRSKSNGALMVNISEPYTQGADINQLDNATLDYTPASGSGSGGSGGGSASSAPTVNFAECALQLNGSYLCTPAAVSGFGPITVANTGSAVTCTIDYNGSDTMTFSGGGKSATLPVPQFAVSRYNNNTGGPANVILVPGSLTFHYGSGGEIDFIMYVAADYSTVQCLDVGKQ